MPNAITHLKLEETDSTNRYVLEHFPSLPNLTLVTADKQTAGRGRLGRTWHSPAEVNFYGSFLLKTTLLTPHTASRVGALAALDALRELAPKLDFWLKWPNDIHVGQAKLAGILCENKTCAKNCFEGIVIGIGVNINLAKKELEKIDRPATSLLAETGKRFSVPEFVKLIRAKFELLYFQAISGESDKIFDRWKQENKLIGGEVTVHTSMGEILTGKIIDFGREGELKLDVGNRNVILNDGEISIKNFHLA